MPLTLLLAGCGKMGGALLEGWLETDIRPQDVTIVEPNTEITKRLQGDHGVITALSPDDVDDGIAPVEQDVDTRAKVDVHAQGAFFTTGHEPGVVGHRGVA